VFVAGATRAWMRATVRKETPVLVTILIILAIIALVLFIWRNMAGRRV
jgi:hypothetical protein